MPHAKSAKKRKAKAPVEVSLCAALGWMVQVYSAVSAFLRMPKALLLRHWGGILPTGTVRVNEGCSSVRRLKD